MSDLTTRQKQVLDFIKRHISEIGLPPTGVEMAKHFKWASPNASVCHFKALEKKGYLSNIFHGASRVYLPTDKGELE